MKRKRLYISSALLFFSVFLVSLWAVVGSKIDFTLGTTSGNPAAGKIRLWANTSTGLLECLSSSGASCLSGGTTANNTVILNGGTNVISGVLAANTRIIIAADVTQNTSTITISQNNVTIEFVP